MYKQNGKKISLILFCSKKEQADRKKEQAKCKSGEKRSRLEKKIGKKGAGWRERKSFLYCDNVFTGEINLSTLDMLLGICVGVVHPLR
jgi:hypothetical protein